MYLIPIIWIIYIFWIKSHFTKIINLIYTHIAHLQFKWDPCKVHYNIQRPLGFTQVKKMNFTTKSEQLLWWIFCFFSRVHKTLKFFQLKHIFLNFVLCLLKKLKHCILILYENNWTVRINSYKTKPFLSCMFATTTQTHLPFLSVHSLQNHYLLYLVLFYAHRVVKYS